MCVCVNTTHIYTHTQTVYVMGRDDNTCFSQGCEIPTERSACCTVKSAQSMQC